MVKRVGQVCSHLINTRSFTDFILEKVVRKLGLQVKPHLEPYESFRLPGDVRSHFPLTSFEIFSCEMFFPLRFATSS